MMFSSTEPISREMDRLNSFLFSNIGSSSFKNSEAELFKSKEIMGSDPFQQSNNGGLARYRSAPSSFFAGILDGDGNSSGENFVGHDGSSSSESESMFTALLSENNNNNKKGSMFGSSMKQEVAEEYGNNGYENLGVSGIGSYSVGVQMQNRGSIGVQMQNRESLSNGNGGSNNLIRQSSSPAGFLNGFDIMRDVENYRSSNRETSSSSIGLSSSFMPIIAENESWNENCLKRNSDGDLKMFSNNFTGINTENVVSVSGLTHHLSLPKTSTEMAAVEKYLRFQQDSVPCKIRAKRGCATHPRSIAERVRRTRISDRMKKLQELFPDMDKQTNTADMLDLAVDYIKDLQKQVQTLRDKKAKCSCPSEHSYGT